MNIHSVNHETVEFGHLEPVEAQLLLQIYHVAETNGDEKPERRIYSDPIASRDEAFLKDWDELIKPELHHLFQSSRQVVEEDLEKLEYEPGHVSKLRFPRVHVDAWLNALNQARLVLAARHDFTEEELSEFGPQTVTTQRDFILFQINFYAAIQESLMGILEQG